MEQFPIYVRAETYTMLPIVRVTLMTDSNFNSESIMLGMSTNIIDTFIRDQKGKMLELSGDESKDIPPGMNAVCFSVMFPSQEVVKEVMQLLKGLQG